MADITATMVKALRDATEQGMMECKRALQETDGDLDAAKDVLRKKGLATAEKKAARTTTEGRVAIKVSDDGKSAAMIELVCETDFCARNDEFQAMVAEVIELAAAMDDGVIQADQAITDVVQAAFAKIGENMSFTRGIKISAAQIGVYIHHNSKVGVLVGLDGELAQETLSDLCMHIAFADPMGITADDISAEVVEKERKFATQQAIDSGKPKEIAEKMVEGKMKKFLAERALIEQKFVRDESKKIKDILGDVNVTAFARYAIG